MSSCKSLFSLMIIVMLSCSVLIITGCSKTNKELNAAKDQGILFSDDNRILLKVPEYVDSVTIPACVVTIAPDAFNGCKHLTEVTIPDSVLSIGERAFANCLKLKKVKFSNNLKDIGNEAFSCCKDLTSVFLPDSVISIGEAAFFSCRNLNDLILPSKLETINDNTFSACVRLTDVTIPDGVRHIGKKSFSGCVELSTVAIPNSVKQIDNEAFAGCSNLTNVKIPANVKDICMVSPELQKASQRESTGSYRESTGDLPYRESTGDKAYDAFLAEFDREHEFIFRKDDAKKSYEERVNQLDEQIRRSRILLDRHSEQSGTREYKALEKRNSSLLGQRAMF